MGNDRVLRLQEFADRMQISIWTARQWTYVGKITTHKIGKLVFVPEGEVDRLLQDGMRPRRVA